MRPETKERADTIIGSVLRGSFTFYQATAGDMRGERARDGNREERKGEREREREEKRKGGEKVVVLRTSLQYRNSLIG